MPMLHSLQERCIYGNENTLITTGISSFQQSFSKTTQGLFLIFKKCTNGKSHFLAVKHGVLESY